MKITKRIPNFVDTLRPAPEAEGSWAKLQKVKWIRAWAKFDGQPFRRFSRSNDLLMAEYGENGEPSYAVGRVHHWREDPEFQALPVWVRQQVG